MPRWKAALASAIAALCPIPASAGEEADLLAGLLAVPGVSGREEAVREAIRAGLPEWARRAARADAMGNLTVTAGSGAPSVLYVAHMDEIGYMVTHVREDGLIQVQKHGGFYDRQYEGRVVQIHTASGPVSGVVIMPSTHLRRDLPDKPSDFTVESVLIDVGAESRAQTEALGVALLDPITVPKTVTRLAGSRLAARSMDDRFGCAALLALARRIQPSDVRGTLTLAWSVQEEVGLRGAQALAREFSPEVVVPVDSFVTSDSPLESPRLADAPLGEGPMIRALDSSNIAPIGLVRSLLEFARGKGLVLGYGATMGGNDGSVFRNGRSRVLPLAIPIRYSHTAVETIDTRDLTALVALLDAMVRDVSWAR
jgi:putative aminopeptidase FrvX